MNNFLVITCFAAGLLSVSCSNGGRNLAKVEYCSAKDRYLQLSANTKYNSKVLLKPNEPFAADASDFAYVDSSIYYYDTVRDIKILLVNKRKNDGSYSTSVGCTGGTGINPKMSSVEFEAPIISDILVANQRNTLIKMRNFKIKIDPAVANKKWYASDFISHDYIIAQVATFYSDYRDSTQYFTYPKIKKNTVRRQLISHLNLPTFDEKSNKDGTIIIRVLVNYDLVDAEKRRKIDETDKKKREEEEAAASANIKM